jgi:ketosteroid isomerase-like protein
MVTAQPFREILRAMSENVEAFKRGLEAGNRGDIDGLLAELHPEIEWHSALHVLIGGQETVFRGHAGVRRMIADLYETFAEVRFEISEFRDLGDGVVAIGRQHTRGKASGVESEAPIAFVTEIRDGKTISIQAYRDRDVPLAVAGMPE